MFVAEAAEDLGGGVPLLPGRLLVGAEHVVNDGLEWIENRLRRGASRVGFGLGLPEDLPDLAAGVMEKSGQLSNAEFVDRVRPADACVFVHPDHPAPPCSWTPKRCTSLQEACWGWTRFRRGDGR
jgi:hypothetical protein